MVTIPQIKKLLGSVWLISALIFGSSHLFCVDLFITKGDQKTEKTQKNKKEKTNNSDAVPLEQMLQGEVEVSFKIGTDGRANILNINSANPALVNYVRTKLNKIQLQKDDINLDEIITYRFIFKDEV